MASLGQELKRERELRAISLKEIANLTKISLRYLQALEDDKLERLPGTFFIKGVLRSYSKCIGVDENYFVNKYHAEVILREDAQQNDRRNSEPILPEPKEKRPRLRLFLAIFLILLLAAAAGATAYIFIIKPGKDNRPVLKRAAVFAPEKTAAEKIVH